MMAHRFSIEIVLTDRAYEVASQYRVDVADIARAAIQEELTSIEKTHTMVEQLDPVRENTRLRAELLQAQEQMARLISGGVCEWERFI